jgi:copper chaperone CopZ
MPVVILLTTKVIQECEDKEMNTRSFFHLDCTGVIPECGFQCDKCVKEIESVLSKTRGVNKSCREGDGILVEHDPDIISAEQLIDIFKRLPSFYKGFFIPKLMTT